MFFFGQKEENHVERLLSDVLIGDKSKEGRRRRQRRLITIRHIHVEKMIEKSNLRGKVKS